MSAYRYLAFVVGVGVLAVLGAVLNEFVLPVIEVMRGQSTTEASSQGIEWYAQAWDWMPLVVLLLLVLMLLLGIMLRRRAVVR